VAPLSAPPFRANSGSAVAVPSRGRFSAIISFKTPPARRNGILSQGLRQGSPRYHLIPAIACSFPAEEVAQAQADARVRVRRGGTARSIPAAETIPLGGRRPRPAPLVQAGALGAPGSRSPILDHRH